MRRRGASEREHPGSVGKCDVSRTVRAADPRRSKGRAVRSYGVPSQGRRSIAFTDRAFRSTSPFP